MGKDLQTRRQVLLDSEHHHPGRLCDWKAMAGMQLMPHSCKLCSAADQQLSPVTLSR